MNPRIRKILKALLILSIIPSLYLGIKAMFIDLYNPGSAEARELSDIVNYIFWITIVLALPLVYEKVQRLSAWKNNFYSLSIEERESVIKKIAIPMLKQVMIIIIIATVAAVIITMYAGIPPEVIANYKAYYSRNITSDLDNFNYYYLNNNGSQT